MRLIRWDSFEGKDVVLHIHRDGTMEKITGYDDDGDEVFEPVTNLFEELKEILDTQDEQIARFNA
jgi:hypothetical protein